MKAVVSEAGWRRLRAGLLAAVCWAGAVWYLGVVRAHYPIDTWLAWRLGALFAWVALFSAGAVGAGSLVVERLLPRQRLHRLEAIVLSMAAGVVVFGLLMYLGGALAWFGPWFAVLLQLGMAVTGIRSVPRLLARGRSAEGAAVPPRSWLGTAATFAGGLGVLLVYFGVLTPDAINYDATWSHLTVAQDYAREGRIVPFAGDYNKQVPHLASIVYSWGFMVPGLDTVGHWMLAQHLEFAMFLWTLAGVAAAVRWVVAEPLRGIWSAFFLFPSILVYDNNLGAAADHVLAFFGPPLVLAARHFFPRLAWRPAVLLGMLLGGAALTKYQAAYFVVPMGVFVALRLIGLAVSGLWKQRRVDLRLLLGPLVLLGTLLLVVSPHFIKNAVFHGNPVYPFMQRVFSSSHPIGPESWLGFEQVYLDPNWVPTGTAWEKFVSTLGVFFTFSFLPHYSFTAGWPTFGSLFTLLLPCVLFLRKNLRLLFVIALPACGLLMWAATFRVDRNLQIILPLFVIATAALIATVWRFGAIARVGLVPLVALQVLWGADAPFLSGFPRYRDSIDIIRSGYEKGAEHRFDRYRAVYRSVGQQLPLDASVLLHGSHTSLGVDRKVMLDWWGFQAQVSYDHVRTAHELVRYYRSLGITHLLYMPQERIAPSKQEEILWLDLVNRYSNRSKSFGHLRVIELPATAPPQTPAYRVLCLGLEGYADGIYDIADLNTKEYLPPQFRKYAAPQKPIARIEDVHLAGVDAALVAARHTSNGALRAALREFPVATSIHGAFTVYLPKRPSEAHAQ